MKNLFLLVFFLSSLAIVVQGACQPFVPAFSPVQMSFALSIASLISLFLYLLSFLFDKVSGAKGVVHNPQPDGRWRKCPYDPKSRKKVQIVRVYPKNPNEPCELILYHNKTEENLCDGDEIPIAIKNDRIGSFLGIGGSPIKFSVRYKDANITEKS